MVLNNNLWSIHNIGLDIFEMILSFSLLAMYW